MGYRGKEPTITNNELPYCYKKGKKKREISYICKRKCNNTTCGFKEPHIIYEERNIFI